jgi:multidrug efflux system outer membrane protein
MTKMHVQAAIAAALAAGLLIAAPAQAREAQSLAASLSLDAAAPRTDWWTGLNDPLLDEIVGYALTRNRDLRAAEADVRRARALAKLQNWSLLPTGGLGLGGGRTRDGTTGVERDFVGADGEVAWELDLFGRLRAGAKAARYDALTATEIRRGVMASVAAQIASTYVELRGAQTRLAATDANAAAQAETLRLTQVLHDAGRATPLDVTRAEAQLESTRAAAPLLRAQIEEGLAALDILAAGLTPEMKVALLAGGQAPAPPRQISLGAPEDILRRRPDIREAEARLNAARARVRAAKVDWWPRLTFLASGAEIGGQLADLDGKSGLSFTIGPRIDWPALDFRRNALRTEAARAGADAEYERYEKLVFASVRDLDAALAQLAGALQAEQRLQVAVASARRAASISRLRYREGADPFFAVLDAERSLAGFEDSLALARARSASAYIRVGQVLGAGWSDAAAGGG